MQNAIKLENISNLITSPSSYQYRKTRLVHFVIHGRYTSMECMLNNDVDFRHFRFIVM
jgi:hypothetical protein